MERLCEKVRVRGSLPASDELAKEARSDYFECVYQFGSTDKVLQEIARRLYGHSELTYPGESLEEARRKQRERQRAREWRPEPELVSRPEPGLVPRPASRPEPEPARERERLGRELGEKVVTQLVKQALGADEVTVTHADIQTTWKGDDEMSKKSTREEALKFLAGISDKFGRMPTVLEINNYGGMAYTTLTKHLGPKADWEEQLNKYRQANEKAAGAPEGAPAPAPGEAAGAASEGTSAPASGEAAGVASAEANAQAAAPVPAEAPAPTAAESGANEETAEETMEIALSGTAELKARIGKRTINLRITLGD